MITFQIRFLVPSRLWQRLLDGDSVSDFSYPRHAVSGPFGNVSLLCGRNSAVEIGDTVDDGNVYIEDSAIFDSLGYLLCEISSFLVRVSMRRVLAGAILKHGKVSR